MGQSDVILSKGEPLTTASGGSLVRGEVNRNKQAAQWAVAPIEVAESPHDSRCIRNILAPSVSS